MHEESALSQELAKVTIQERRWAKGKHLVVILAISMVVAFEIAIFLPLVKNMSDLGNEDALGVVQVSGVIEADSLAGANRVIPRLKVAFEDERVKRVAVYIDSPGGAPVEAERISAYMSQMRAKTGKPVVAVIGNLGASAGYMIALGADSIVAGRYSLVGSIGAVIQSWDLSRVLEKVDVTPKVYASGKLKSMLNPFLPSTAEGNAKAQNLADSAGTLFAADVAKRRGKKLTSTDYATGEVWNGEQAKALGLIDELSTLDEYAARHNLVVKGFGPTEQRGFAGLAAVASDALVNSLTRTGAELAPLTLR